MELRERRVAQIVRDFFEAYMLSDRIGEHLRAGDLGPLLLGRDGDLNRALVIDCDVHHGNGTAHVFANDASVFTLSLHQEHNYPAWKPPSDLDIGLADGTGDAEYLELLNDHRVPLALQLSVPSQTPLPPRSLDQLTEVTSTSSEALPPISSEAVLVL